MRAVPCLALSPPPFALSPFLSYSPPSTLFFCSLSRCAFRSTPCRLQRGATLHTSHRPSRTPFRISGSPPALESLLRRSFLSSTSWSCVRAEL